MNDVEFILKEDIKEKKQAGRGYYHKKNGSKSKKCHLPSDSLSKKEIEKMNGECKVYNFNKLMSYSNFCAMPVDLQIKYLETLRVKLVGLCVHFAMKLYAKDDSNALRLMNGLKKS